MAIVEPLRVFFFIFVIFKLISSRISFPLILRQPSDIKKYLLTHHMVETIIRKIKNNQKEIKLKNILRKNLKL